MTKTRILIISVIILALINVATLGSMFMHKKHHKKRMERQQTCQNNNQQRHHKKCKGKTCDKPCKKQNCRAKSCNATQNKKGNHRNVNKGDKFKSMISQKLGFNDEQKTKFDAITKTHFAEVHKHNEEKKVLKKELFELLKDKTVDEQKKSSIITKSLELERKMLNTKITHFDSIKSICEPDQIEGLLEIIERMGDRKKKMH